MPDKSQMPLEAYVAVMQTFAAIKERRAQEAMRFGPRSYTSERAEFIEDAVQRRSPLPEPPLQVEP